MQAAFADISQNPANIAKHQSNPKVMKVMEKLTSKMGGGAASGPAGGFQKSPKGHDMDVD